MTINHNAISLGGGNLGFDDSGVSQGIFTSDFDVNFDAIFTPVSTGAAFTIHDISARLINTGGDWTHYPPIPTTAPYQTFLKHGSVGDQAANCHELIGLNSCNDGDFFPSVEMVTGGYNGLSFVQHVKNHRTRIAIDTPGPLPILGLSTAYAFARRLRKRTRAASLAA